MRGARRAGAAAAHLVSVFAHRARLVLGQLAVAEKSNEIPCVRRLLKLLPRRVRLLVTVDAMHTQVATAKLICSHAEIALPDDRQKPVVDIDVRVGAALCKRGFTIRRH